MTALLKLAPTRNNLLALRSRIAFLERGYELLDRKRELLSHLVKDRLASYRSHRRNTAAALVEAYKWLAITQMKMSGTMIRQAALGMRPAIRIKVLPRSSLGIEYPEVAAELLPLQPVGLMWTDPSFDEAREHLARAAVSLAILAEAETALWRLLEAQRKTQKRVNALRYNVIPRYRATLRHIEAVLEEEERNTLFQMRRLSESRHAGMRARERPTGSAAPSQAGPDRMRE